MEKSVGVAVAPNPARQATGRDVPRTSRWMENAQNAFDAGLFSRLRAAHAKRTA
jgi:hypothetical protein